MRRTRLLPSAFVATGSAAIVVLAQACNAIVGNGDIQIANDGGAEDATLPDGGADASSSDARVSDGRVVEATAPEASANDAATDAGCPAGTKLCGTTCRTFEDPAFGCGPVTCDPCELSSAVATCGLPDGGGDGGLACAVDSCRGTHRDCNGDPRDGCEVDTAGDLYNCGACGHDCTMLPNVAGNVSCSNSVCVFNSSACAPGYGICTTDPDNGCDTVISAPANCGACGTVCPAGVAPYCSPSGGKFACTSGCAAGLSLCSNACVNLQTDPKNCHSCGNQCPAVAGGTATCSPSTGCGFICNPNEHLCGTGSNASCAANNDPTNCGTGAACGTCPAPANATASCTGGSTCGYACSAGAHACGTSCPLNTDPNNCGTACGTNCPGPTQGTGTPICSAGICALNCTGSTSLCGTACVNEQTDSLNCGSCGHSCGVGQTCSAGACTCNAASCPGGCCDSSGACRAAPLCVSDGGACVAGCPATVPEASNLVLWLVGDTYVAGASTWADQSGHHADATCSGTSCPSLGAAALNGHAVVSFDGTSFFALSDPAALYQTSAFTIFAVAAPDPTSVADASLLTFADGTGNSLALARSGSADDLMLQLLPGSSTNSIVAPGAWSSSTAFEAIKAAVDASQSGLTVGASTFTGAIGSPAFVDYLSSFLASDPSHTLNYSGQIAEIVVYNTTTMPSAASIQAYLSSRYALP